MSWLTVKDALKAPLGTQVTVKGWLRTRRDSKADGGLSFLAVHDGTCFEAIQAVARADLANYSAEISRLTTHCAVEVDGTIAQTPKGANEIHASAVRVVGWVEDPDTYPVQPKQHTFEYLREVGHLRVRTNTFGAVARVRHCLAMAVHRFFHERGFYWVHTPIITGSDCEGAGQMFRVSTLDLMRPLERVEKDKQSEEAKRHCADLAAKANMPPWTYGQVDHAKDFFGKETHLTVSGQLNVETYCCALSRVYTFGPTFRAENSNTSRHLAEFWMIEPEVAFADLSANATLAEEFVKYLIRAVLSERADDMKFFDERIEKGLLARLSHVAESPFQRLSYTEAVGILAKAQESGAKKFEYSKIFWGMDLQSEHERFLTEEHFKRPVILMNYPKGIKAFYMRMNDEGTDGAPTDNTSRGRTVAAMDVLVPGVGELIGGSQREERLEMLDARIAEMGLPAKEYWWYRDLRRYGTVPHAGFGLGFERLVLFCTGMGNIRDVIPFPRTPGNAEF